MNQQYSPTSPASHRSQKGTWKNGLAVIFLFLSPIIGLILMWAIATWSKKAKIIITIVLVLPALVLTSIIVLVSIGGAKERARDTVRERDMDQIATAQEMYHRMNDHYYQSVNYPSSIPDVMVETPRDASTEEPYGWIDNTGNDQKFCAYADLEKGGFYVASNKGIGEIATEPLTLSDCERLPGK